MTESPRPDVSVLRADVVRAPSLADAVLRMIWEQQAISRAEIARRAELSRSTVSEIVSVLLSTTLVAEAGVGESRGGRRPIVLQFQDDACSILGVDMGATHISVVLTDLRGRVLAWRHRDFPVRSDPSGTRAAIIAMCEACLAGSHVRRGQLLGIGVAVPSPMDPRYPERLSALAMPDWEGKHGLELLGERFEVPVLLDNDANLGALAERWWGAARGLDDFTFIKVATGIGSGHFIGGRIYRGATGVAGEIGHLAIDTNGQPCVCGNRGCLVTYIGSEALVARAQALFAQHPSSTLIGETLTANLIEDAALAGDPVAVQVMFEVAEHLGVAVAGMLNLMNPAAVIFGGGLARLGEQLLVPLRQAVMERTFVGAVASSQIKVSELEPRGVAIGAATLVLDAALHDPSLFPTITAT
ncbi:MAG: ROK family transcriptional regulator [Gemmatimonadaceae bacterium]|nr:ROK family transcriptional regulator [Gemmatimonadaceae bacterium]